jgi:DNA (cytosine-5)-methyltransferase 1
MLDLFSGIGGFSLAARWAGIETIQFVEKDSFCQKVLQKNFPNIPIHNDIKNFHFHQAVDIITGGFPCQPFSVAGKKKGINDDRYLWPEMLRLIRSCKPNWVVAENVVGVVAMELDNILSDLERENYETQSFIIPACAANAPHRRDRLWIIANRTCERCDVRSSDWKKRYLQENKNGNMAALQSEWEKLKPKPWQNMSAYEFIQANAGFMRINDGLPNRMDRIKSLGNAIVPQIAYVFLKAIQFCSM